MLFIMHRSARKVAVRAARALCGEQGAISRPYLILNFYEAGGEYGDCKGQRNIFQPIYNPDGQVCRFAEAFIGDFFVSLG